MSKSLIACAIDTNECAVVRLKTSGDNAYSLGGYKTLPFGFGDLASGRGTRMLKKLDSYIKEWPDEELALCIVPENYLLLPAVFPAHASSKKYQEYCKIEARYFLSQPDDYDCDCASYGDGKNRLHEKKCSSSILLNPEEEPQSTFQPRAGSSSVELRSCLCSTCRSSPERRRSSLSLSRTIFS